MDKADICSYCRSDTVHRTHDYLYLGMLVEVLVCPTCDREVHRDPYESITELGES